MTYDSKRETHVGPRVAQTSHGCACASTICVFVRRAAPLRFRPMALAAPRPCPRRLVRGVQGSANVGDGWVQAAGHTEGGPLPDVRPQLPGAGPSSREGRWGIPDFANLAFIVLYVQMRPQGEYPH